MENQELPTQDLTLNIDSATALLIMVDFFRENYEDTKHRVIESLKECKDEEEREKMLTYNTYLDLVMADSEGLEEDLKEIIIFLDDSDDENKSKIIIPSHLH